MRRIMSVLFWAFALFLATTSFAPAEKLDLTKFIECNAANMPAPVLTDESTVRVLQKLEKFAKENQLPVQWMKFGPPDRQIERMLVGVDFNNKELFAKYMKEFQLEGSFGEGHEGTLVMEFYADHPNNSTGYVVGTVRPKSGVNDRIYRYGNPDVTWAQIDQTGYEQHPKLGLRFFSHLIGLNKAELENFRHYIAHPDERAPVKSANCVAWTSSIELGRTCKGAKPEERGHLFNLLGMSRSMDHREIGRRLIHAANERHRAIIVVYEGEKGRQMFADFAKHMPPIPTIPYRNIIHGYKGQGEGAAAAVKEIPDGAKVFVPIAAGASPDGMKALMERAAQLPNGMDIHILVNGVSEAVLRQGIAAAPAKVRVHALFLGGNARKLYSDGLVSVIPGYLGDFNRFVNNPDFPAFHYDTILVRVSPANADGFHSLGPNQDMVMSIIRKRPGIKIIAEVNPNVPFTRGDNMIESRKIHAKFESDSLLAGPTTVPLSDVDAAIGRHLATLIPDGAYLQLGIGNIFGGLPQAMKALNRKNINIHTEMFGDAMMELIKMRIGNSANTGFAYGSPELYKWLHNNQQVNFVDTEYVNNPATVAGFPSFHAVNTALQVNLRGEVNATHGPEGRLSSPGGQVEFMSGAAKSVNGKAILVIRSTAKEHTISTITTKLYGPVTTPAEMVTHVVTEHGVAVLVGRSESERAMALIRIAEPKFRLQLIQEARDARLITEKEAELLTREIPHAG